MKNKKPFLVIGISMVLLCLPFQSHLRADAVPIECGNCFMWTHIDVERTIYTPEDRPCYYQGMWCGVSQYCLSGGNQCLGGELICNPADPSCSNYPPAH